jgi:hypothetical protein
MPKANRFALFIMPSALGCLENAMIWGVFVSTAAPGETP